MAMVITQGLMSSLCKNSGEFLLLTYLGPIYLKGKESKTSCSATRLLWSLGLELESGETKGRMEAW